MGFDWIPAKNYKRHYICMNCRKGFKRPSVQDMKSAEIVCHTDLMNDYYKLATTTDITNYIKEAQERAKVVCPNCKSIMVQVHYNFEVPKHRDTKSWRELSSSLAEPSDLDFEIYIKWHRTELDKLSQSSKNYRLIKSNLRKLELLQ